MSTINFDIKPSDIVCLTGHGKTVKIVVETALNYGLSNHEPNWYIQGNRVDNGQYVYVKQHVDGVTITKPNA